VTSPPDEADLVWIAAVATGSCFTEVVESCDAAAVSAIAAEAQVRAWATDDPVAVAATLLVGIARRRPFRHGNAAAAWLAAAHVISTGSMRLTMPDELAVELVSRAGGGAAGQPAVAAALAAHVTPRGRGSRPRRRDRALAVARRGARWLTTPARRAGAPGPRRAAAPGVRAGAAPAAGTCPACGRPVHAIDVPGARPWIGVSRYELTALCWYEHRAHGRDGRAAEPSAAPAERPPDADRWAPVTEGGGGAFLAATAPGALLFLPSPGGTGWTVALLTEPCTGDLVGDWSRLAASGEVLGRAGRHAVRLQDGLLDLRHLARHGDDLALEPAAPAPILRS
jgi:hypothetical protein